VKGEHRCKQPNEGPASNQRRTRRDKLPDETICAACGSRDPNEIGEQGSFPVPGNFQRDVGTSSELKPGNEDVRQVLWVGSNTSQSPGKLYTKQTIQ